MFARKHILSLPYPLTMVCEGRGLIHGQKTLDDDEMTHVVIDEMSCNSRDHCSRINQGGSAVPNVNRDLGNSLNARL